MAMEGCSDSIVTRTIAFDAKRVQDGNWDEGTEGSGCGARVLSPGFCSVDGNGLSFPPLA